MGKPHYLLWSFLLCFTTLNIGLEVYAAEVHVNVGWAELIERERGWQVRSVLKLGNWNLELRPGDLILEVDGQDVSKVGPISIASFLGIAELREVGLVVQRKSQKLETVLSLSENPSYYSSFLRKHAIGASLFSSREPPTGPTIHSVVAGGPAEQAGLQKGDELVAIDGQEVVNLPIRETIDLLVVAHAAPVRLRVRRGTVTFDVDVSRVPTRRLYAPLQSTVHRRRGQPAPAFSLPDSQGDMVSLEQFRGRWVLLNFWATWCAPCRLEIPLLKKWAADFAGKLVVLGLNVEDKADALQEFLNETPLPYNVLIAGKFQDKVPQAYNVRGIPLNVIVSPDGTVAYLEVGFLPLSPLESHLQSLLAEPARETK